MRTYYMPNHDWRTICQRGRELRIAAGTLTGHAAGHDLALMLDAAAVAQAIGASSAGPSVADRSAELPEPLASVIAYLGNDLDTRDFIPTAELVDTLDLEPTAFGRQMGELGCQPRRSRVIDQDGPRQVRGYTTADLRAAADEHRKPS